MPRRCRERGGRQLYSETAHVAEHHGLAGRVLGCHYSAQSTETIVWIEQVCPILRKVPTTRHFSPTEHGLSGSWPDPLRSIVHVVVALVIVDHRKRPFGARARINID
jgi:hypothetical protein